MERDTVLRILADSSDELRRRSVRRLAVFGSVARGEATDSSDVDILVEFDPEASVGLFEFVRLRRYLSELLGREVDLATPASLHPALRDEILREAIDAA
jgi:predicted nucleotidyltransferase